MPDGQGRYKGVYVTPAAWEQCFKHKNFFLGVIREIIQECERDTATVCTTNDDWVHVRLSDGHWTFTNYNTSNYVRCVR